METLNFVQVQLKPRSDPLKIAQIRSKSLKIAYFGPSRRVQEASSAFSRTFCRLGWSNISTLLPTVSGVLVNIQHKQLVEFKTTEGPVLTGHDVGPPVCILHSTPQLRGSEMTRVTGRCLEARSQSFTRRDAGGEKKYWVSGD